LVFNAPHHLGIQGHLNHGIDQILSPQILKGGFEQGTLEGWNDIRNEHDQTGVQVHAPKKPKKVRSIVGNERDSSLVIRSANTQSGRPLSRDD
jgi:hypothetical protein